MVKTSLMKLGHWEVPELIIGGQLVKQITRPPMVSGLIMAYWYSFGNIISERRLMSIPETLQTANSRITG